MSLVMEEFPNLKIQYVGIDIDSHACTLAKKNLRELEIDCKVLCQDFQDGVEESVCVHTGVILVCGCAQW